MNRGANVADVSWLVRFELDRSLVCEEADSSVALEGERSWLRGVKISNRSSRGLVNSSDGALLACGIGSKLGNGLLRGLGLPTSVADMIYLPVRQGELLIQSRDIRSVLKSDKP